MKKRNGFTLIELLAVIVIIALIMILVIPAVLEATNKAKKELFYDYSRSVQSKAVARYIQDMDDETIKSDCLVYDISTDLGMEDTGDYEGWAKVSRVGVADSEKKTATVTLNIPAELIRVQYCTEEGNECTPNKVKPVDEGATSVTISELIRPNQVLCANIQYNGGSTNKVCQTYDKATASINSYEYNVTITMKSRDHAVNAINFSENTSKKDFYNAIDEFAAQAKDKKVNPMAIPSPTCSTNDPITYKGTTTLKNQAEATTTSTANKTCPTLDESKKQFDIILNPNGGVLTGSATINQCVDCSSSTEIEIPTRAGYIFDGWYYDKAFSKQLVGNSSSRVEKDEDRGGDGCIRGYKAVYLYAKWILDEGQTTTSSVITTDPRTTAPTDEQASKTTDPRTTSTTARDTSDETLRLSSLTVSGYDIGFSPIKYDYSVEVPYSQTSIGISAQANTPSVTDVRIEDSSNLGVGTNVILVHLTNHETGKATFYRVVVVRLDEGGKRPTQPTGEGQPDWDPESGIPDPTLDESNASLIFLQVSGYDLDFNPNVYNYDLEVRTLDDLGLTWQTATKGAFVTVVGNQNLKDGSEIEVNVVSLNGFYNKKYKITIRYNKVTSTGTRYLRNLAIVLGIVLAVILAISAANKKQGRSIIKKKEDENNNPQGPQNTNNPDNLV